MTTRTAALQALAWLQALPDRLKDATETHTAERDKLRAAEHWTQEHRATLIEQSRQQARDTVAQLTARAAEQRRTITDYLTAEDTRPATDQLLDEQRETRAWARLRPLLDQGAQVPRLTAAAEEARDLPALRALRAELPAYLQAKNPSSSGMESLSRNHDASAPLRLVAGALARTAPADSDDATRAALGLRLDALAPLLELDTSTVRQHLDTGQYDALGYAINRSYLAKDVEATEAAITGTTAQEATE